jgi:hypothetical protein
MQIRYGLCLLLTELVFSLAEYFVQKNPFWSNISYVKIPGDWLYFVLKCPYWAEYLCTIDGTVCTGNKCPLLTEYFVLNSALAYWSFVHNPFLLHWYFKPPFLLHWNVVLNSFLANCSLYFVRERTHIEHTEGFQIWVNVFFFLSSFTCHSCLWTSFIFPVNAWNHLERYPFVCILFDVSYERAEQIHDGTSMNFPVG